MLFDSCRSCLQYVSCVDVSKSHVPVVMAWLCLCSGDGSAVGDKPLPKKQKKKKMKKAAKRDRGHREGITAEPATKLQKCSDSLGLLSEPQVASDVTPTEPQSTLAASEHAQLDMSAWDDYGLDALVVSSLARLGFTSPTDIQHECLPAAILGNADVIAAAQTVRYLNLTLCKWPLSFTLARTIAQ